MKIRTPTVPVEEHVDGCPMRPQRAEESHAKRRDGTEVVVVRCLDCGGQAIYEKEATDGDE